jgi:hypothetical protein
METLKQSWVCWIPAFFQNSEIWRAADEEVLNNVRKKSWTGCTNKIQSILDADNRPVVWNIILEMVIFQSLLKVADNLSYNYSQYKKDIIRHVIRFPSITPISMGCDPHIEEGRAAIKSPH